MQYMMKYPSMVGELIVVSDGTNITGLWMCQQKYYAATVEGECREEQVPTLLFAKEWLDAYFSGKRPDIAMLPLKPKGSEFRQIVWKHLCQIPYGETTTYGEIAKKVARQMGKKTMSAQAVGGAVGHNPIGIIIPCHRVIGKDGSLTGYAGGLEKKIQLLAHEGIDLSNQSV